MILDSLKNITRYSIPQTDNIIAFITKNNCFELPNGQIDIDGDNLFVRVMEYHPKDAAENKFETHRRYADVQYLVKGTELMQLIPADQLTPLGDYDSSGDYQFFKGEHFITDLAVREGEFAYFYPGEAHRPSCLYLEHRQMVKKLVFKVRIF